MDATHGKFTASPRETDHDGKSQGKLIEMYSGLVPRIAKSVVRSLPPSFETSDLEQIGFLALLEAEPRVEAYVATRVRGAMIDSVRYTARRESQHASISDMVTESPSAEASPLAVMIEEERRERVTRSVAALPKHQAQVITARFGESPRRRGAPRKADVAAEREALSTLRVRLAKAA